MFAIAYMECQVALTYSTATGKTITRRYAGLREHPAKNASQMIADEMLKAIEEEEAKQSPRGSRAGVRKRQASKRAK